MTREHKLALIIGFTLVLVVGVLISDHFSKAHEARVKSELPETPARNLAVDGLRPVGAMPTNPGGGGGSIFGPASASAQTMAAHPNLVLPPVNDPMASPGYTLPERGITMGNRLSTPPEESNRIAVEIPRGFEQMVPVPPRDRTLMNDSTRPIDEPTSLTRPLPMQGEPIVQTPPPGGNDVRPIRPDGPTIAPPQYQPQANTINPNQPRVPPKEELLNGVPLRYFTRHDVQEGESMYRIAKDTYGDGTLWPKLREYNAGKVMANGSMRQGVTLLLPPKEALLGKPLPPMMTNGPGKDQPGILGPAAPQPAPTKVLTPDKKDNRNSEKVIASVNPPRNYTVQKGDVLSDVSRKTLGTSKRWMEIHDLNKDALDDEDSLVVGMVLKIPAR